MKEVDEREIKKNKKTNGAGFEVSCLMILLSCKLKWNVEPTIIYLDYMHLFVLIQAYLTRNLKVTSIRNILFPQSSTFLSSSESGEFYFDINNKVLLAS